MKDIIKKIWAGVLTLMVCALFASCNGLFSSKDSSSSDTSKIQKVRVSFSLKDIASREIRPNNMTFEDVVKIVLYAKKKSGNEYKDYIFEGGDSSKEWRTTVQAEVSPDGNGVIGGDVGAGTIVLAYNAMASDTVLLEVGTYNFTLELYTLYSSNDTNEHLAQVATKNDFEITASTTSIDLGTASFADTGCLSVTLRWDADENDQSRVSKVEAGLFTLESNGVEPAVYDENTNYDFEIITTYFDSTNNPDGKNTYYGEYAQNEVKNGTYILKYRFYSKAGDEEKLINTVTEIVKIKGFKTEKEIFIDLKKLNVFYNIEYNLMGGTWKNSEDYRAGERTRNAYTAEILPNVEDMIPPSGKNTFVGWYTDENFTEESLVTDIGAGEDYARDYTLYAKWDFVAGSSGKVSYDNRSLFISAKKTNSSNLSGKIVFALNDSMTFTVKDKSGKDLDAGENGEVTLDATLLYKGQDVNSLISDGNVYKFENGTFSLCGPVPKEGDYQLYVTASQKLNENYNSKATSCQTYNLNIQNTPITQLALYDRPEYDYYYYYLVNSEQITSSITRTDIEDKKFVHSDDEENKIKDFSGTFAFDAAGKFYTFRDKVVYFKNGDEDVAISLKNQLSYDSNGFMIDYVENVAYAYDINEATLNIYKYPNLIQDGASGDYSPGTDCVHLSLNDSYFYSSRAVVNNGILYVLGVNNKSSSGLGIYMADLSKYNESFELTSKKYYELTNAEDENSEMRKFCKDNNYSSQDQFIFGLQGIISDMIAQDGFVYLLLSEDQIDTYKEKKDAENILYNALASRGAIIKIEFTDNSANFYETGWVEDPVEAFGNSYLSMTYYDGMQHPLSYCYETDGSGYEYSSVGMKLSDFTYNSNPNALRIYCPTDTGRDKFFYGPKKIIGLKPKKLVISDEGIAYYTDDDGVLRAKNVNRIVEVDIDLEKFAIDNDSIKDLPSLFEPRVDGFSGCVYKPEEASLYYNDGTDWKEVSKTAPMYYEGSSYVTIGELPSGASDNCYGNAFDQDLLLFEIQVDKED